MRNIFWCMGVLIGLWFGGAQHALAQSCTFSATDLAFGEIKTLSPGSTDLSGNIIINCGGVLLNSISGTISATAGSGGSNGTHRQMANGTSRLNYQLYRDPARTNVFDSTTGGLGGAPISFSGGSLLFGNTMTIPFYGRVFGGQSSVPPGSYLSQFNSADIKVQYRICIALLLCENKEASFTFFVTATVEKECAVSAMDIDFGSTGGLTSAVTANGRLDVLCTPGTDFQVSLNNGQNGTAANDRKMKSPAGGTVHYNLYRDAGHTAPWGSTLSTDTLISTGNGTTDSYTVYGRVPAQPTPAAGVYTDTIIVTLTY